MMRTCPRTFIDRPVATTLLTLGIALAGALAFRLLPVSPLPQVDFPTISVQASLPGASPETMAATVATPLERSLGRIAGVTEMTSCSSLGSTRVTLQFDLEPRHRRRRARRAGGDQRRARLAADRACPSNPTYRKVNPADAPIMILALTSDTMTQGQMYDAASTDPRAEAVAGRRRRPGHRRRQLAAGGARRAQSARAQQVRHRRGGRARGASPPPTPTARRARSRTATAHWQIYANDQAQDRRRIPAADRRLSQRRARCACPTWPTVVDSVQDLRNAGMANGKPSVLVIINRQPNANIIETVDRVTELLPSLRASIPSADRRRRWRWSAPRPSARRCATPSRRW